MKVCVGVISIGEKYLAEFERLFKPSVSAYCARNGYDLKVFTTFLDSEHTQPDTISFQKCLVPSQLQDYDLVVVLDADIYIEPRAPPIHLLELSGKVGIVDEVAQSSSDKYQILVNIGFADHAKGYYQKAGFELETTQILNTGVMVCSPLLHSNFLKSIYEKYVEQSIGHPRGFHYEQACIGFELQTNQMYTVIPNDWNFIQIHTQITKDPVRCYFLHFAGLRGGDREAALARHTFKGGLRWGIKK